MREIEFRGKRTDNGKWCYGDLRHDFDGLPVNISDVGGYWIVDPNTVGQFVGINDMNDCPNKIFEDDVLEDVISGERGSVCYCESSFYIELAHASGVEDLFQWMDGKSFVFVIGNIYDNPELMK